jgi:hypothetical protein
MSSIRYLLMYEGSAEQAICDLLVENSLLHFSKEQMLFEKGVRGLVYEKIKPLLGFSIYSDGIDTVRIYRIKDKKNIPFKIGVVHKELLKKPVDVLTRPEIEMLYIISEGKHAEYIKQYNHNHITPCVFVKDMLRCKDIKKYEFVHTYFGAGDNLLRAINYYHKIRPGEITLWDILQPNYIENHIWQSD